MPFSFRFWNALLFIFFAIVQAAPAHALGVGGMEVHSNLGQPLKAWAPVFLSANESLAPACVRSIPPPVNLEALPTPANMKVNLVEGKDGLLLLLTSAHAVHEPAIRVGIRIGCQFSIVREFVLLLDPPLDNMSKQALSSKNRIVPPVSLPEERSAFYTDAEVYGVKTPPISQPNRLSKLKNKRSRNEVTQRSRSKSLPAKKTPQRRSGGDRLRLAEQDGFVPRLTGQTGMRVELGIAQRPPSSSSEARKSLTLEQMRFTALMQDRDPNAAVLEKEEGLRQRLAALSREMASLRQQMDLANAPTMRMPTNSSWNFWLGLAFLVAILGLVSFAVLLWKRRQNGDSNEIPSSARQQEDFAQSVPAVNPVTQENLLDERNARTEPFSKNFQPSSPGKKSKPMVKKSAFRNDFIGTETPLFIQRALLKEGHDIEVQEMDTLTDFVSHQKLPPASKMDLELDLPHPTSATLPDPQNKSSVTLPKLDFGFELEPPEAVSSLAPLALPLTIDLMTATACQHALRLVFKVVSEAEVLTDKGQHEQAIVLLRKFVYDSKDIPPTPWLMLLNLYKKTEKSSIYEASASRFVKRFGRSVPDWGQAPIGEEGMELAAFPTLREEIMTDWGTPACMAILYNALVDSNMPDERFFNLTLQKELLNLAHTCRLGERHESGAA